MTYEPRFEDYRLLLAKLSFGAARKMRSVGLDADPDDLFQEASITFMDAARNFDTGRGVKFSTYLWRSVQNRMTRILQERYARAHLSSVSMDANISEDGGSLHDVLASDADDHDETMGRLQEMHSAVGSLSKDAQRVILTLRDMPEEVQAEFDRIQAFTAHCSANGFPAPAQKMSARMIARILGFGAMQERRVVREIDRFVETLT